MSTEPVVIDPDKLENFTEAFSDHSGGCRRTCECGKEYWDTYNSGYSWEDGEIEGLEKNPDAVGLPHSVSTLSFEGREYVMDCTCFHDRASRIMNWIDTHAAQIANYLNLEKKRKQAIADAAPTVEEVVR